MDGFQHKIHAYRTIRSNRKGYPDDIKKGLKERGDYKLRQEGHLQTCHPTANQMKVLFKEDKEKGQRKLTAVQLVLWNTIRHEGGSGSKRSVKKLL